MFREIRTRLTRPEGQQHYLVSQTHFPKADFPSDNFPIGNFPSGNFPKVKLNLQMRRGLQWGDAAARTGYEAKHCG